MKQSSDTRPNNIVKVAANKWHINYNIEEEVIEDKSMFTFDYVKVHKLTKNVIVNAIIRNKYSRSEEFAILRKQLNNENTEQFTEYNEFINNTKLIVEGIL